MKLCKLISGAALLLLGSGVFAQTFSLHGVVDYTAYGVQQTRTNTDGASEKTDPQAGYDPDGHFSIDMNVTASNFEFNLGLYFTADGGDEEYFDFSNGGSQTPFYQGNMKVTLLNGQMFFYTGKFEDFNAGYIEDGYALGTQSITNLADKDNGQHLTALEFAPNVISGLKFFAGLPVLPFRGNGVEENKEANWWKTLVKKVKLAASYQLPIEDKEWAVTAGFRPGTYYDGVDEEDSGEMATLTSNFTESAYGEGYLQLLFPDLVDGVNVNLSYDLRYRDGTYLNLRQETVSHNTMAHMAGVSAEFGSLFSDSLVLAVEDRFYFADDDYTVSDEKLVYDVFALGAEYTLSSQPVSFGLNCAGMFAADANGSAFYDDDGAKVKSGNVSGAYASYYFDSVGMSLNDMPTASLSGLKGDGTTYLGFYANPYVRFNMTNGAVTLGAEVCYTRFFNDNVTNTALSYRVPVGVLFTF